MPPIAAFYTPSKIPPFELDLVKLEGGGSCPTQFDGVTRDGRDVYVRYRGGCLTIDVASEPGLNPLDDGDRVLEVSIGPVFDGTLSIKQFLALTGLTVDHPLPDERNARDENDLSGATTFWRSWGVATTDDGAIEAVRALQHHAARTMEIHFEDGEATPRELPKDEPPSAMRIEFDLGVNGPKLVFVYSPFVYRWDGYGGIGDDAKWSEKIGKTVVVAGSRDSGLKHSNLSLTATFATEDHASREILEHVTKDLEALFAEVPYGLFDPRDGKRLDDRVLHYREDRRITDWISRDPNRYRVVQYDRTRDRFVGARPL